MKNHITMYLYPLLLSLWLDQGQRTSNDFKMIYLRRKKKELYKYYAFRYKTMSHRLSFEVDKSREIAFSI